MSPPSSSPARLALASLGVAIVIGSSFAACTNTTVYDVPDPTQCDSGNGCGIAVCTCGDGSYMIDSACSLGKCVDPNTLCANRCTDFGGPGAVVSSTGNTFGAVACDVLDDRMFINGCKEGLDLFATTCETDSTCSEESQSFWQCVVGKAVLSCEKGALHAVGCKATPPLALCTPPAKQ